jgi:predicted dithiol-disulfide oxidoreductase (DUF899 family)
MDKQNIVSRAEWLTARTEHLAKEKEFTHLRDQLSEARRNLPWVKIDKDYLFDGPDGKVSLSELFGGCSQLLIYHFMFGPDWDEGCPSCSFWADNYNGAITHLRHRDITLAAISRAPLAKLESYKTRMGWSFPWLSSLDNTFNQDFQVSFSREEIERGEVCYNYSEQSFSGEEAPGISVFFKDPEGTVYHTYSCYSRGLDMLNGAYHLIDLTPRGREEDDLPFTMAWVRRRDQYED